MSSPTWLLLQQLQTLFATILVSNGFRTDIGTAVRLEMHQFDESASASVAIAMQSQTVTDKTTTVRERNLVLVAECLVPLLANDSEQELAHDALEDMLQVLPTVQRLVVAAGITADVRITEGRVVAAPEGMSVIAAQVDISARMLEQR